MMNYLSLQTNGISFEKINIKIDRFVLKHEGATAVQIHTFVDASERAYGTAIYLRST